MIRPLVLSLLISILYFIPCHAQENGFAIRNFSTEDGLSHNHTSCIFQDSRFYIWIGTRFGLNRFDGNEFKAYNKRENQLEQNDIDKIFEDQQGKIWIFYINNRISIFDVFSEQATPFDQYFKTSPIENIEINDITSDEHKNIFILTNDGKILKYASQIQYLNKNKKLEFIDAFNIVGNNQILAINKKRSEAYEINTNGDIIKTMSSLTWEDELQIEYSKNRIYQSWISTNKFRIYNGEVQTWLTGPRILSVKDQRGNTIFDYSKYISKTITDWLAYRVYCDRFENIWVSSNKGLILLTPQQKLFKTFLHQSDPLYVPNSLRGIEELDDEHFFIASYNGFYKVNKSTFEVVEGNKNSQYDLFANRYLFGVGTISVGDTIVVGIHAPAFHIIDKNTYNNRYNIFQELFPDELNFFFRDSQQQIWIGTTNGLYLLDLKNNTVSRPANFNQSEYISEKEIYHIYEDESGILVGAEDGIYSIDYGGKIITHHDLLKPFQVNYILPKNESEYWLATRGSGLILWNTKNNSIKKLTKENGLSSDYIYSIHKDEFGFLWLPSNFGLMRFNPKDLTVNTFLKGDGIATNEFNSYSNFIDSSGQIFLGGTNGITTFHPKDFYNLGKKNIPLKINSIQKLNQNASRFSPTESLSKIIFAPSDKAYKIELCLFDYFNSFQSKYAYQIEGYEDTWNYLERNTFTINRLPYGNYTIKAKAQGRNGVWSDQILSIPLYVTKPFYLKTYFFILIVAALGLLIFSIVKWRVRLLRKRNLVLKKEVETQTSELLKLNQIKDQFFAIIAHDLKNHVISFKDVSEKVNYLREKGDQKELDAYFSRIDKSGNSLGKLLDNLLSWALLEKNVFPYHPEEVNVNEVLEENITLFSPICQTKEINIKNNLPKNFKCYADRNALSTILRNVLNNAIKFSKKSDSILIGGNQQTCQIEIQDFGEGIEKKLLENIFALNPKKSSVGTSGERGVGLGLKICNELMDLNKGEIKIESQKDIGTIVYLKFSKI